MRLKIYQINNDRDVNQVKFMPFDSLEKFQQTSQVDPSIYDEVFNGEVECEDLEAVFTRFNTKGHPLHRGHSLSVSDIVVNGNGAFYCDMVGFKKVDFDETLTHKPDNLMRVVYVEPNRPPFEAEIAHTLEAEQKAVDGLIELVYNEDDTAIVCNDEGKLRGMEGNRRIGDGSSIIAGPFFVCGLTEDDFRSLTDAEAAKYMERFAQPEQISQEEVEADMGYFIFTM